MLIHFKTEGSFLGGFCLNGSVAGVVTDHQELPATWFRLVGENLNQRQALIFPVLNSGKIPVYPEASR
jgi:hypothetical protein